MANKSLATCVGHMRRKRAGSMLVEAAVVLAVVAVMAVIVAQCLTWSLRERARLASQQAALELTANILEEARAQPFDDLNQSWADTRTIPAEMTTLLPDGKIVVTVEPGPAPQTRRVKAELRWGPEATRENVALSTVLSGRTAKKSGGQP